jgi:hypothetical protein
MCPPRPQSCVDRVRAGGLFTRFHRLAPDRALRVRCRRLIPRVLVQLGTLRGVIYSAQKDCRGRPKTYIHFMERPPLLACDPGGRQLYVVGGRYRITRRGIEG